MTAPLKVSTRPDLSSFTPNPPLPVVTPQGITVTSQSVLNGLIAAAGVAGVELIFSSAGGTPAPATQIPVTTDGTTLYAAGSPLPVGGGTTLAAGVSDSSVSPSTAYSSAMSVASFASQGVQAWTYNLLQNVVNALYGVVAITVTGSSTVEGANATQTPRRAMTIAARLLQKFFNPSTVLGGFHAKFLDTGWSVAGGVTNTLAYGALGRRSYSIPAGGTLSRTDTGTGYTINYGQGPGVGPFTVSIDGSVVATVTPDTTGSSRGDGVWNSGVLARGAHPLVITSTTGTAIINDAYVCDGDNTAGLRVYNNGMGGAAVSDFIASGVARISSLGAALHIIIPGATEIGAGTPAATFQANLQTYIAAIKAASSVPPSFLIVGTYKRPDASADWAPYLAAMNAVAQADPSNVGFIDLSKAFPANTTTADPYDVMTDGDIHMTDRGHAMFGTLIYNAVLAAVQRLGALATSAVATVPGQVTGLAATPGNGQVILSWTAPASNGGAPVTDYIVQDRVSGGTFAVFNDGTSASTTATVTGLTNGTAYDFEVAALNSVGVGAYSSVVTATPTGSASVPGAPTGVALTPGDTTLAAAWTAPASNGGAAITDYVVQYRTSGSTPWTTLTHSASTTPAQTITGLTDGTAYNVQVAAVNSVGTGPFSTIATATPNVPAYSPTSLPSLQAWYDPSSIAQADGSAVSSWSDKSPNAYTASQSTAAAKPVYKTAGIGSAAALLFDGTRYLQSSLPSGPAPFSLVCTVAPTGTGNRAIVGSLTSGGREVRVAGATTGTQSLVLVNQGNAVINQQAAGVTASTYVFTVTWDGTTPVFRVNGQVVALNSTTASTLSAVATTIIGAKDGANGDAFIGSIGDIVQTGAVLSLANIRLEEQRQAAKYGLSFTSA